MDCYMKRHGSWLALDTFNRADGSLGTADSGQNWTVPDSLWKIVSNKAKYTVGGTGTYGKNAYIDSGITNHTVEADIVRGTNDDYVGLCFQTAIASPDNTGWRFRCSGTTAYISLVLSGTFTDYASAEFSWSGGVQHHVKVVTYQSGGNLYISAYIDGVLITSYTGAAYIYSNLTNAGLCTIRAAAAPGSTFDNFKITRTL